MKLKCKYMLQIFLLSCHTWIYSWDIDNFVSHYSISICHNRNCPGWIGAPTSGATVTTPTHLWLPPPQPLPPRLYHHYYKPSATAITLPLAKLIPRCCLHKTLTVANITTISLPFTTIHYYFLIKKNYDCKSPLAIYLVAGRFFGWFFFPFFFSFFFYSSLCFLQFLLSLGISFLT